MIIKNTEKQILQKYYAEQIKSLAASLKEVIQNDKQDLLVKIISDIEVTSKRICQIQKDWRNDTGLGARCDTIIFNEAEKSEQKDEDDYKKQMEQMVKNNTGTDIDVLTKSDGENIFPIKFQPMPKRFMVWDTKSREWLHGDALREFIECNMQHPEDNAEEDIYEMYVGGACKIVQSTNLFDKDGKEIFEGGIIDYDGDGAALGMVVSIDGQWQLKDKYGNLMFLKGAPHQKLVGHILLNPELVKEKAC